MPGHVDGVDSLLGGERGGEGRHAGVQANRFPGQARKGRAGKGGGMCEAAGACKMLWHAGPWCGCLQGALLSACGCHGLLPDLGQC
jgi:hypothetical protein